jgi:hypothetical protein
MSTPRMEPTMKLIAAFAIWAVAAGAAGCKPKVQETIPGLAAAEERGDSMAIARLAVAHCLNRGDAKPCYEEVLMPMVERQQVGLAMSSLNAIAGMDSEIRRVGHEYAHGIGMAAYKPDRDVGKTFASCSESFQSGCYHGVIQSYFTSGNQVGEKEVTALCAAFTSPGGNQWLRFQCAHGMGHGLDMFYEHDLPQALKGCDLLADNWDRESCYGGAFMENVANPRAWRAGSRGARRACRPRYGRDDRTGQVSAPQPQ